jgi:hypothetical protein
MFWDAHGEARVNWSGAELKTRPREANGSFNASIHTIFEIRSLSMIRTKGLAPA